MKALRGQPTLRGLVVRDGKPGDLSEGAVLYPWPNVGAQPDSWGIWNVYSDDGTLLREEGNRVRIRIPDTYETAIARKAQARWFKRALDGSGFRLTEEFERPWAMASGFAVCCLGSIGLFVFQVARLAGTVGDEAWKRMPLGDRALTWLSGLVMLAMSLALVAGMAYATRLFLGRPRAARAVLDKQGLAAVTYDGRELFFPWAELDKVSPFGGFSRIRTRDHRTLWMYGRRPRTHAVLRAVRAHYLPERAGRAEKRARTAIVRMAVLTAIGAALAGVVSYAVAPAGERTSRALAGVSAVLLVGSVTVFMLAGLPGRLERWERRVRKRKQRKRRALGLPDS